MDDPIKVIWKFKNKNKRIQYHVCIFLGNVVAVNVEKILKKIKDLNLFDTLISVTESEYTTMKKYYGDYWYRCFFNSKHISFSINNIRNTKSKKEDLVEKYGNEWYKLHISDFEYIGRTYYNYSYLFKQEKDKKHKIHKLAKEDIDDEINDYTTVQINKNIDISQYTSDLEMEGGFLGETIDYSNYNELIKTDNKRFSNVDQINYEIKLNQTISKNYDLIGGYDDEDYNETDDGETESNDDETEEDETEDIEEYNMENLSLEDKMESENDSESEENMKTISEMDEEYDVSYDDEEISNLQLLNMDEDPSKITGMIEDVMSKENINKKYMQISEFDDGKSNNLYDINLKDIYSKIYIFNQYIFKDDTIQTIKNKITCGIKQDLLFGKSAPYILPSRMYLWSEYEYEESDGLNKVIKTDKIMLGQKWVKRNEILNVDIEPNENLRIYEQLRGNLKNLKDNILKYGSRIKKEFDETNILDEYINYITNNEIYMLDIYHDLGKGYEANEEVMKNLFNVYVKIYYNISQDEFKQIIDYLNNGSKTEVNKILQIYQNLNNDLILENEVCKSVEELKLTPNIYNNIFKENYVTQSVIHVSLQHINIMKSQKIDLFRIFDNFIVDDTYPFLQFQTIDGKLIYKFYTQGTETDKNAVLAKWFENAPYGISFKIKVQQKGDSTNKYISVNLNENGSMEYKTQWKEDDLATIEDVKNTYPYIRNLLSKINLENDKLQFMIPGDDKFKYAFINTIQQIELPDKYTINHNDLSDFARYFFPYIAVVVEPRKRQSKIKKKDDKSKYGTYLRYKRMSKYENDARIEHRIIYFLRNYEYVEKLLTAEIAKQFNITEKIALEKILDVKSKFPNLKKSRKILKKLDNIPKYKPPGINIDIQGKQRTNYKMRVSGARNKYQLDKIINFMNILIHLYIETYLKKNPQMTKLKEKLKSLNNIAKRRNKVEEIINIEENVKSIKQITKLDKERLAYKPGKGENHWARNCQNSGDDKKRRPIPYTDKNLDELIKQGYVYNPTSGDYEKTYTVTKRGKKKDILLRAAKLTTNDGLNIYWTCDPEENKDHMFVGFLSRSANPNGLCMPCCFKKDHYTSRNKEKKDFYLKCVGKFQDTGKANKKLMGEKLYILQDTNKIQEGRFGYLPKYLEIYFNIMLNKNKIIKNHYLLSSKTGYYFKFGSRQDEYPYLNAISSVTDMSIDSIKSKVKQALTTPDMDRNMRIFTYLNNGDIRTQFESIGNYLHFINVNSEIDFNTIEDILCLPGIIYDDGMNVFIFEKRLLPFSDEFNDNQLKEDYILLCKNIENIDLIFENKRKNIFMLKEEGNYYPIYMTLKEENSKTIELLKAFDFEDKKDNIVKHISNYFKLNCSTSSINFLKTDNAKTTNQKLLSIDKNYQVKGQIIDQRNKCKYLLLNNDHLIPIKPSGSLWNIPIINNVNNHINDLESSIKTLMEIYNLSENNIYCKVQGFIYNNPNIQEGIPTNETLYHIIAIITDQSINLPVNPIDIKYTELQKITNKYGIKHFITESRSLYDDIDNEIIKGKDNMLIDKRIIDVNRSIYEQESYERFRLELSIFLNNHYETKEKLETILENEKINKLQKKELVKKLIYKITNKELYKSFNDISGGAKKNKSSSKSKENEDHEEENYTNDDTLNYIKSVISTDDKNVSHFVNLLPNVIDDSKIINYTLNNNRDLCKIHNDKNKCSLDINCSWQANSCKLALPSELLVQFINKVVEEFVSNELKSNELIQKDNYFVSDIVNPERFKERKNQKIIKSINFNIQKILGEIFGKNNIPQIGKNRPNRFSKSVNQDVINNPLEKTGNAYVQVVNSSNGIFRAYANCFYWLKNIYSDISYRNLGFYSPLQTDLANLFKSFIIDYLLNKKRTKKMISDIGSILKIGENNVDDYLDYFIKSLVPKYISIVDLYILNQLHHIPIIIYDVYDQPFLILDNGIKYLNITGKSVTLPEKSLENYIENNFQYINIKFGTINPSLTSSISNVYSLYFLNK